MNKPGSPRPLPALAPAFCRVWGLRDRLPPLCERSFGALNPRLVLAPEPIIHPLQYPRRVDPRRFASYFAFSRRRLQLSSQPRIGPLRQLGESKHAAKIRLMIVAPQQRRPT